MPWPAKSTAMVSRDRCAVDRFDGDVDGGADRSVDAAHAPGVWRVDVGDLGGAGPVGAADAPGGEALVADGGVAGLVHVAVDDALLPLVEAGRVGGVGEHLVGAAGRPRWW